METKLKWNDSVECRLSVNDLIIEQSFTEDGIKRNE